jgi:hypothetical protein
MSNINVINLSQQLLEQEVLSDTSSLWKRAYELNRDDCLSELSLGSFEEEEEELTEEDRMKIERWTRIREDGFEMINGVKYSETGSIIYSDYDREEEEPDNDCSASEIGARTYGDLLREEARQRIEANPEAYEGLPRGDEDRVFPHFDWEQENAVEIWNALMLKDNEICERERDIYLANGGITNKEMTYLHRHMKFTGLFQ